MCVALPKLTHTERKSRLDEVESKWEEKKQSLAEELARVEKLLASAYDRSVG